MTISRATLAPLLALVLIAPQPKWTLFVSHSGGFAVLMPGRPDYQPVSARSASDAVRVGTWTLQLKSGAAFGVVSAELPADAAGTPLKVLLDGARDGQLKNTKGKLLAERDLVLRGHGGREVTVRTSWGVYACRFFVVRRRLFQVLAATPASSAESRDRYRFLNSFRLLKD